jgi:hypothetical protein
LFFGESLALISFEFENFPEIALIGHFQNKIVIGLGFHHIEETDNVG